MCSIELKATDLIARIKQQVEQLTHEQAEALKTAIYIGMTPEEARRHDERREKITRLTHQLRQLQQAQ